MVIATHPTSLRPRPRSRRCRARRRESRVSTLPTMAMTGLAVRASHGRPLRSMLPIRLAIMAVPPESCAATALDPPGRPVGRTRPAIRLRWPGGGTGRSAGSAETTTWPSSIATGYVLTRSFESTRQRPVATSNSQRCQGQRMISPPARPCSRRRPAGGRRGRVGDDPAEDLPVQSGPDLCGQRLRSAWNWPLTLNTPMPARPRNGTTSAARRAGSRPPGRRRLARPLEAEQLPGVLGEDALVQPLGELREGRGRVVQSQCGQQYVLVVERGSGGDGGIAKITAMWSRSSARADPRFCLALQGRPHFPIALGGPDDRPFNAARLVISA